MATAVSPPGTPEPILVAESVTKVYRTGAEQVVALRAIDLTVHRGEFVSLMGPSGSGKTTLLNCLSGLDSIDGGRVVVLGQSIHEMSDAERTRARASSMGFIFQSFNLIPVFSAAENVELPLLLAGVGASEARKRANETLARVGLGHRTAHRPMELSGGEQQRVTVARALAGRPQLVWADEPTGNLDSESAASVMDLLRELNADGMTLLVVTHDAVIGGSAPRQVVVRDGVLSEGTSTPPAPDASSTERAPAKRRAPRPTSATAKTAAKKTTAKKTTPKKATAGKRTGKKSTS